MKTGVLNASDEVDGVIGKNAGAPGKGPSPDKLMDSVAKKALTAGITNAAEKSKKKADTTNAAKAKKEEAADTKKEKTAVKKTVTG